MESAHKNNNDHPQVVATINEAIRLANANELSAAAENLKHLSQDFPNTASVHGYLAWFQLQLGQFNEAIEHSELAVNLAPTSEKASLVRFHSLWNADQKIEAYDEMKRFLLTGPCKQYAEISKALK